MIFNEDCLETMKRIEDKTIDLVLTDPPYGVNFDYDIYDDSEDNWKKLMTEFIPEAIRISKMLIMPTMRIAKLQWIYEKFPPDWLIAWYKGSPGHRAFIGFNDWEPLLVYGKTNGLQMHDYFYCMPEIKKNGHPCPKPIKWAEHLIVKTTKENDMVYDPFMGSGTTLVAAIRQNRQYMGSELSEKYFNIAKKRINAELSQTNLFKRTGSERHKTEQTVLFTKD